MRDEVEGARRGEQDRERERERREKEGAKGRKRETCEWYARTRRGRTTTDGERAARDATNRRRTTRLGSVGGAVIQPNAQVCRRLAGASLECRPAPPSLPLLATPSVGRSGRIPPRCPPPLSLSRPPPRSVPLRVPSSIRAPPWYRATSPSTTTIANYGTQAQVRAHGRTGIRAGIRAGPRVGNVRACVRAYAPRRRYVTSSHGNQCSWPPTRSHGAKPTRPAS